jgi:hypothetical protein
MSRLFLVTATAAVLGIAMLPTLSGAADRDLPRAAKAERYRTLYCGCCGCLNVSYDYHRELRSTYGTGFDPRNYDQTEPHYYFGRVRAYPQYWTDRYEIERHY